MRSAFVALTRSYVCERVFRNESPVLLVSRPDGDWCFLCGESHPPTEMFSVIGMNHLLQCDPSLAEVLDLKPEWEAERTSRGAPWLRMPIPDEGMEH